MVGDTFEGTAQRGLRQGLCDPWQRGAMHRALSATGWWHCQSLTPVLLCLCLWQVMLLIDIELAYMNTNHEDFIGFAK